MSLRKKNYQGFIMLGLDFDHNYGQEISGCMQFEFRGYEISVSTGAISTLRNIAPIGPSPILVTALKTGCDISINGSVEDAIEYCIQNPV